MQGPVIQVWVCDTRPACIINPFSRQMIQRGFHSATFLGFQWHHYSVKPVNLKPQAREEHWQLTLIRLMKLQHHLGFITQLLSYKQVSKTDMETSSSASAKVCILFGIQTQSQRRTVYKTQIHTDPLQHALLQGLSFKQRALALLSQEMNCQKALSGHILTPGLHSKCLKERPDEASVTAARAPRPSVPGRQRHKPSSLFF